MKYEELAFVNQQLATMLREGIPLEGSLRQLCATMQKGRLRAELQLLENDLAGGVFIGTTDSEYFWEGDLAKRNPVPRFQVYVFKRK